MPLPRLACLAAVAAVLAISAAGCGGAEDRPAKWSFISATITEPSCATVNCHSAITQRANVDLHSREAGYHALVYNGYVSVTAPAQSTLLGYLNATAGPLRMPPDNPLPDVDIQLIEHWIVDGALDN